VSARGERSLLGQVAWSVALPALLLMAIGVAFVWSTTRDNVTPLAERQLLFAGAGLLAGVAVMRVGVRRLAGLAWPGYLAMLGLLMAMPLLSDGSNGTDSWISLPFGFKLQPSEFMKLALILVLSRHLQHRGVTDTWSSYAGPFLITAVPWFFVMRQPDLGSAMVLLPIFVALVTVSGARLAHVALLAGAVAVLLPLAYFVPGVLRDYQRERLDAFLRPIPALMDEARELRQDRQHEAAQEIEADIARLRLGIGRQQFYSVMALGSGGLAGQGLGEGLQNRNYGVAVRHADFIFAIIGEEWGLLGTTAVMLLYAWLLAAILGVAYRTREPFGRLLCVGVAALVGGQALLNLAIATGLLPVTGLTLPFVSYGGSSLVASVLAVCCVLDVARQRVDVFFES
jgi:rod shape determining protein RodA